MNQQKSLNNKGFSLVELIIVIAIMAILIGVMAPNLLRYVEKTNVSADTQLADSIRTAIQTALMDPSVKETDVAAFNTEYLNNPGKISSAGFKDSLLKDVAATLNSDAATGDALQTELVGLLKSTTVTPEIWVEVTSKSQVIVTIKGVDNTGGKKPEKGTTDIVVQ